MPITPLQTVMKTLVKQAGPLQPMEVAQGSRDPPTAFFMTFKSLFSTIKEQLFSMQWFKSGTTTKCKMV